jgi:RNA polymerase primary sigma factor
MESDFVLRLYLRDISSTSRAAPARESWAAEPGRLDETGRQQLVLGHLPRVVRIAFDYQGLGLPLGDLIGEGNIGLMRAAELFDPVRNVAFACYAKPWIRVRMQRALSYQARPLNVPADFSWRRSRSSPPPSFVPLESPWPGNETDLTLAEVIPDETSPAPDREAALHSDRDFVDRLIAVLSPAEQKVIRLRFGLDDGCHRTLAEVGRLLGYGRQGIHRIQSVALSKLRHHARYLQAAPKRCDRPKPSLLPPLFDSAARAALYSRHGRGRQEVCQRAVCRISFGKTAAPDLSAAGHR